MWAVDGLYYLGIEEDFGIEAATEIEEAETPSAMIQFVVYSYKGE